MRRLRVLLTVTMVVLGLVSAPLHASGQLACVPKLAFGYSTPGAERINPQILLALTRWIRETRVPIFSLLISRDGKIVYQLFTPGIGRDDAHYLMSVTKSVTSALVGAAIDRHLLQILIK